LVQIRKPVLLQTSTKSLLSNSHTYRSWAFLLQPITLLNFDDCYMFLYAIVPFYYYYYYSLTWFYTVIILFTYSKTLTLDDRAPSLNPSLYITFLMIVCVCVCVYRHIYGWWNDFDCVGQSRFGARIPPKFL